VSPRWSRTGATPAKRLRAEADARVFEMVGTREGVAEVDPQTGGPDADLGRPTAPGALSFEVADDTTQLLRADDTVPALATATKPVPLWRQMLEIYTSNRLALISTGVLLVIIVGCYVGPHLYVTNQTNENALFTSANYVANAPPSAQHWFGTDDTGWDVLGRIMYGGQYSLALGFFAGLVTIIIGTVYGMVSGFFGGITDAILMRFVDAALSIPSLFLLVALLSIFHNSTTFLLLVIGLTGWFGNSRIIRGDALVIRDLEYSIASVSMGASRLHVVRRHVFPNSISNIVTVGTFSIADAILALSALGFIGFGVQAPAVDWGTIMYNGTSVLIDGYWWETYPVAIVFVTVIICINYMGDALRDIFEVRLRQR
jgi:peptide/nickel transport system permease protein